MRFFVFILIFAIPFCSDAQRTSLQEGLQIYKVGGVPTQYGIGVTDINGKQAYNHLSVLAGYGLLFDSGVYKVDSTKFATAYDILSLPIVTDHGALTGLLDDDHTQYALLAGRSGGQTLIGGTGTTDDLIFRTTSGVGATGADMRFQVGNNGATETMKILNNGQVAMGVVSTAPAGSRTLDIIGNSNAALYLGITQNTSGSASSSQLICQTPAGSGFFGFFDASHSQSVWQDRVIFGANSGTGGFVLSAHNAGQDIRFVTAAIANERMRIEADGDVGIGVTTATAKLHVVATSEQLRLGFDASNLLSTTVSAVGLVTMNANGTAPSFTFADDVSVPDEAFGSGWNASLETPTKNAIYDYIATSLADIQYTPTETNPTNLDAYTINDFTCIRVGLGVDCSGLISFDANTDGTLTSIEIDLPYASDLINTYDLVGSLSMITGSLFKGNTGIIIAEATNNTALIQFYPDAELDQWDWTLHFKYKIQ